MKNYPEPESKWLDVIEMIVTATVAVGLLTTIYYGIRFATILIGGAA